VPIYTFVVVFFAGFNLLLVYRLHQANRKIEYMDMHSGDDRSKIDELYEKYLSGLNSNYTEISDTLIFTDIDGKQTNIKDIALHHKFIFRYSITKVSSRNKRYRLGYVWDCFPFRLMA
jgi:hypothetical protein